MISEDFIYAGQTRRDWDDWYNEEVVNREQYKTLFYRYKHKYYQFEPIGFKEGELFNGKKIVPDSYIFLSFSIYNYSSYHKAFKKAICFDSLKDAIDNARMDDGKSFKEIWDDPEGELLDFL